MIGVYSSYWYFFSDKYSWWEKSAMCHFGFLSFWISNNFSKRFPLSFSTIRSSIYCYSYVLFISYYKMAHYLINRPFCSDDFIRSYEIIRSWKCRWSTCNYFEKISIWIFITNYVWRWSFCSKLILLEFLTKLK